MRLLRSLLLALVVMVTPATVFAQEDDDNQLFESAGPLGVPVGWRTLSQSCKSIGFDAEQMTTARTLYSGYRAAVRESLSKGRKGQKALEQLREGENPDWEKHNKEQHKIEDVFVKELEAHEKALMTDLRAVCSPDQEPRFSRVEQARRRELGRIFTIAPGEALDLSALLDTVKVTRTPPIEESITQWHEALDKILIERDRMIRTVMAKEAGDENFRADDKAQEEAFGQFRDLAQRIGDLNRRVATELAAMLPADKAELFTQQVRVRTFPRIYGVGKVERAITTAKARADLTAEQKQKLEEVLTKYTVDVAPVNTRWAAAADEKFRTMGKDFMAAIDFGGSSEESKEPFYVIRRERRALEEKYLSKVNEVLNEEQREEVRKVQEKAAEHEFLPEFLPDVGKDFESTVKEWSEETEDTP
jgi:hypothetical protein